MKLNDDLPGTQGAPATLALLPPALGPFHPRCKIISLERVSRRIRALAESGLHGDARGLAAALVLVLSYPRVMAVDFSSVDFSTVTFPWGGGSPQPATFHPQLSLC